MSTAAPVPLSPAELRTQFAADLVRTTGNFRTTTWLGHTIRQNTLDLWVIQETIAEVRPALLIECGTNYGGSALFYAHLFDLLGHGEVITIDVQRLHALAHPRITFLQGSSVDPAVTGEVARRVRATRGPVLVILDSDHSESHVRAELDAYARFATVGSYVLVQDGVIDELDVFASGRPGPLPAIRSFLEDNPQFVVDRARCARFPVTHHPLGWLQRRADDRVGVLIAGLAARELRRIAIFGTGSGAEALAREAWLRGLDVVAFLERADRPAPSTLLDAPVRRLSDVSRVGTADAFVVGSLTFGREMHPVLVDAVRRSGLQAPVFVP